MEKFIKKSARSIVAVMAIVATMFACTKTEPESNVPESGNTGTTGLVTLTSETSQTVSSAQNTVNVTFTSTASWTASLINNRPESWCTISPTSGGSGSNTIRVSTTENTVGEDRSALIVIKSGNSSQSVKITQKQQNAITLTSSKFELAAEGGKISIEVKANVDFQSEISANAKEWLKYVETKALKTSTLIFEVSPNGSFDKREGEIVISSGNLKETVKVYQAGEIPKIVLNKNEYIVKSAGGTFSIDISSNVDVDMKIEHPHNSPVWITENKTRTMSSHTYNFSAEANESYDSRDAFIIFTNKANELTDTVKVYQLQKDAIVLGKSEYNLGIKADTLQFDVMANVEVQAKVSDDAKSWISQIWPTKGLVSETLYFKISEYGQHESRKGTITLTGGDVTQTITINQGGINDVLKIQKEALIDFYNATGGPDWANNTNWCSDKPLNEWHGISTNDFGFVTGIALESNHLVGYIPSSISNLSNLENINLQNDWNVTENLNEISGNIPDEIGYLTELRWFNLKRNRLEGKMPESIGSLSKLESFDIATNNLNGSIPENFFNLKNLLFIDLSSNQFSGELSEKTGNLTNLTNLYLYNNKFTGTVPDGIGNLTKLVCLSLGNNQFTGTIPDSFANLKNLEDLSLNDLQLSGKIPSFIGEMTKLKNLNLHTNKFEGSIPENICNLTELEYLYLGCNQLGGTIPENIGNMKNLIFLTVGTNQLTGNIPADIGKLTQLEFLYLDNNKLTGSVPESIGYLTKLKILNIAQNELTGLIPNGIFNLPELEEFWYDKDKLNTEESAKEKNREMLALIELYYSTGGPNWANNTNWCSDKPVNEWYGVYTDSEGMVDNLDLLNNNLQGTIPASIGTLSHLLRINLGTDVWDESIPAKNKLTGQLPASIGNLSNLTHLHLHGNEFEGTIPESFGNLSKLKTLGLSHNKLEGTVPECIYGIAGLESIELGSNNFSGKLSENIGNLSSLKSLSIAHNTFEGALPESIGKLTSLESMWIEGNKFSGTMPEGFRNLKNLKWINMSGNSFEMSNVLDIICTFTQLEAINFGDCKIAGTIPQDIGNLTKLKELLLSRTELTGDIPASIRNLTSLEQVALDGNKLSGTLPDLTPLVNLFVLYLHDNPDLGGKIPASVMEKLQEYAFHNSKIIY